MHFVIAVNLSCFVNSDTSVTAHKALSVPEVFVFGSSNKHKAAKICQEKQIIITSTQIYLNLPSKLVC